jgi:hypothetical protein
MRTQVTVGCRVGMRGSRGMQVSWTLTVVYDAVPAARHPHDVIAAPRGRSGHRLVRPGPHARATWLTGSVRADPQAVIAAAFDQPESRDPDHTRPRPPGPKPSYAACRFIPGAAP